MNSTVSKEDALVLLEIIGSCISSSSVSDLQQVMAKTNRLIDFSNAVYAKATIGSDGVIADYQTFNYSYPDEWLELYKKRELYKQDPIVSESLSNHQLQYWADTYKKRGVEKKFVQLSQDFRLFGGYASGVINRRLKEGCLLSLAGDLEKHPRNFFLLDNLTPHLHSAFDRILCPILKPQTSFQISHREKEVLNWVRQGKTTWDISMILKISERTVKFHVDNVMRKLDAVSRAHAVAIAMTEGLIGVG